MKQRLDIAVNVLMATACVIVICVGGLQLKAFLRAAQAAPSRPPVTHPDTSVDGMELNVEGAVIKGSSAATIAFVEFLDFQCPYCGRYEHETFGQIQSQFVDTGKVRYIVLDFPLQEIHRFAFKAAQAAGCAAEQDQYWQMHDRLFSNQNELSPDRLLDYAKSIDGLDISRFANCVQHNDNQKIRHDLNEGRRLGVASTPTFLIGDIEASGRVKIHKKLSGAQPFASFETALKDALSRTRSRSSAFVDDRSGVLQQHASLRPLDRTAQ